MNGERARGIDLPEISARIMLESEAIRLDLLEIKLMTRVRGDVPVEVVEKREKVEAEFYERLFFVLGERSEDLCRIVGVVVLADSGGWRTDQWIRRGRSTWNGSKGTEETYLFTLNATRGALRRRAIHWKERRKRRVRKAWAPISGRTNWRHVIYQSNCTRKITHSVETYRVKLIAEVDGVDIIALQVGEHYYLGRSEYKICADERGDARRRPS